MKLASGAFLVAGKQFAAFPNSEEQAVGLTKVVPFLLQSKLEERGAYVALAPNWQSQAVVSGRLVTGQNPQSAHAVARGIVELARIQSQERVSEARAGRITEVLDRRIESHRSARSVVSGRSILATGTEVVQHRSFSMVRLPKGYIGKNHETIGSSILFFPFFRS